MIQRIQSIYLLIIALINSILPNFFLTNFLHLPENSPMKSTFFFAFIGIGLLAFVTIFMYKKRQNQFVFNRLNILLNLILLGVFAYLTLQNSSGENLFSEKGVLYFVPIISIVFLFLANKAIYRDEKLVKSVDRLR